MFFAKIAQKRLRKKIQRLGLRHQIQELKDYQVEYWRSQNEKPTLVLLNGFGTSAEFQWYKQLSTLAPHYDILMLNLLYFGQSRPLTKDSAYQISDQIKMIEQLIENLQLNTISLFGISYGGVVAAEFTESASQKVDRLILMDSPLKFFETSYIEQIQDKYKINDILDFFAPPRPKDMKVQFKAAYLEPPFIPAFILRDLHKYLCIPYNQHWRALMESLIQEMERLRQQSYDFQIPVHLIWGEFDDLVPLSVGQLLQEDFHSASLDIIKGTKHMPNLERPKLFNKILSHRLSI